MTASAHSKDSRPRIAPAISYSAQIVLSKSFRRMRGQFSQTETQNQIKNFHIAKYLFPNTHSPTEENASTAPHYLTAYEQILHSNKFRERGLQLKVCTKRTNQIARKQTFPVDDNDIDATHKSSQISTTNVKITIT